MDDVFRLPWEPVIETQTKPKKIEPKLSLPADLPAPTGKLQAAGRELWDSVVGSVILDPHELKILEDACRCRDQAAKHLRKLEREGVTTKGARGQVCPHPSDAAARAWLDASRKLLRELALSAETTDGRPPLPKGYR